MKNGDTIVRTQEIVIGDFRADAMRYEFEADIAVVNGGSLNNSCSLIRVCGQNVVDALELSCHDIQAYFGVFLQVSGIRFKNPPRPLLGMLLILRHP